MPISSIDYKTHLSDERRVHSEAVAQSAVALALYHQLPIPRQQLLLAGHYHDLCREWEDEALVAYVKKEAVSVTAEELETPVLLHGPVAADILKKAAFNRAITSAIRHHTLGSPEMGLLGLVLYVADALAPGRTHRSEEERRALLALEPLEEAALAVIAQERLWRHTLSEATVALALTLEAGEAL